MKAGGSSAQSILITGGTSGLGFELVRLFAGECYHVISTGRQDKRPMEYKDKVSLKIVDFSRLDLVSDTAREICKNNEIGIVINNAGIFSSPRLILTPDNLEYTFQVNFLSHLLINEIIIRNRCKGRDLLIAAVTSPVYRSAESSLDLNTYYKAYKRFKIYSESKFLLALMCQHLSDVYKENGVTVIGFDPGVFSSDIFRMQNRFLRQLYRVAVPFMRNPEKVATGLKDIIECEDLNTGSVYDRYGREYNIPLKEEALMKNFWSQCYELIEKYL